MLAFFIGSGAIYIKANYDYLVTLILIHNMASLNGNRISDTYTSLLKTADNGVVDTTLKNITDGAGNATALSISTTNATISGSLTLSGSLLVENGATLSISVLNATSASRAVSSSFATSASQAVSSSYALSSSYAISSSYSISSSFATSASQAVSSSYALSSSFATSASQAVSSSYALSSSFATSASNAAIASNVLGGTTNYLPIWSSSTQLSSSIVYQSGSNVGIGATTLTATLDISGSLRATSGSITFPGVVALNFANDTAASASGIPVGGLYRSGSILMIRAV